MTALNKIQEFFRHNADLGDLFKGGVISLVMRLMSSVIGFLVSLVVARSLGVDQAGLFFLALTVITISATLSKLGLDQVVTRFIAGAAASNNWHQVQDVRRRALVIVGVFGFIIASIVSLLAEGIAVVVFSKQQLAPVFQVMVWTALPFALHCIYAQAFLGLNNLYMFHVFRKLGVGVVFISGLGLTWIILGKVTLQAIAVEYVLSSVLMLLIAVMAWRLKGRQPANEDSAPVSKVAPVDSRVMISASAPLFGVAVLGLISGSTGHLLLGALVPVSQVAVYAVAAKTSGLTAIMLLAVQSVAFPRIAAMSQDGDLEGVRRIAIWTTRFVLLSCLPILIVLVLFAEQIMGLFGAAYVVGATALVIMLVGQFVNVATGMVGVLLSASGNGKSLFIGALLATSSMILFSLLLIPAYGLLGAAMAQVIAIVVRNVTHTAFVKMRLGFMPLNVFARV